ncbi:MAG: pantoate--beta-alanine ligase [Bacteroidales bacterium]|nr:pantoate--beta-alanine ligase [Bacteroidales bacterium]
MKIYHSIKDIQRDILAQKARGLSIGFVPTMGALHRGHLSLLERSVKENDISICSIFVNPIQFNHKQDLEKYPRSPEEDCKKLDNAGCDIVFAPSAGEMYPEEVKEHYDFGQIERVMEGEHRPGHFNGVAVVVKRLFDICMPHKAYFGEKDFQQLAIIKALVEQQNMSVEIMGCPIIREGDGLAMSSRNVRLSPEERSIAPAIFKTLNQIQQKAGQEPLQETIRKAKAYLNSLPGMKVEYIQITDEQSLMPVESWDDANQIRAFIALFLGDVRLIDNLKIIYGL